ncbi:MAG: sodium:proton antiporter NhaD [Flavobacteriales bacterium]|nr:sodium:proton antiporter NhaD [Flavobacteriales bacterium]
MEIIILIVFILGYLAITLEHNLKIDKLVPALLMMGIAWALVAFGIDGFGTWFDSHNSALMNGQTLADGTVMPNFSGENHEGKLHILEGTLLHHFGKTCEILIFLVGAMTIVEIIDHFDGFSTIKRFIRTNKKRTLLWIVCILGFVLSAIIDNLTATIVLITILRKLIDDKTLRIWYAGMIIIAANAGGAWSPIGDVTTTMLWMNEKVSTVKLIEYLIIPSLICMVLPTLIASFMPVFKGNFESPKEVGEQNKRGPLMLYLGLGLIVFVPVFKTVTHLPPYVGMMLSLSIVALVAEMISARQFSITSVEEASDGDGHDAHSQHSSPTFGALSKIEMPSILFFLGILMTVAALESLGMIFSFGQDVQNSMDNNLFVMLMGAGSAVIDNVPLVAASMGMFDVNNPAYGMDAHVWHFIAYAAGTGGSMLIIGSAAGVVAMGMEKISFFWYLKNIAWLALIGYLAGAGVFLLLP